MEKKISVKYFDENVQRLQKIEKGDWSISAAAKRSLSIRVNTL